MDVDNRRIPIDFVVNGEHDMLNRHCQFSDWIDFSVLAEHTMGWSEIRLLN